MGLTLVWSVEEPSVLSLELRGDVRRLETELCDPSDPYLDCFAADAMMASHRELSQVPFMPCSVV